MAVFRLPRLRKRLFLQAAVGLVYYRFAVRQRRLQVLLAALDASMGESPEDIVAADLEIANHVAWAVASAANHLPLEFVCLPRALTGMRLLHALNVSSTLYLGASHQSDELKAHAWLRCGSSILTGGKESRQYQPLATFHSRPGGGTTGSERREEWKSAAPSQGCPASGS